MILILTGVLVTSGCVGSQGQPFTYMPPGDLYRSIFNPYAGLLKGNEMPHIGPQGPFSGVPEDHGSSRSLRDAARMLDENIEKAETISAGLEQGVQYLRDHGKDVSRLESLLEEYNGLVEEARHYLDLAGSSSGEEESTIGTNGDSEEGFPVGSTEKEYLIKSQKSMIRANLVLKDIFDEFKLLMPGSEELNETSLLSAEGEGKVTLMGSFDLKLHLEKGEIAVMSPDSIIKIEGDYVFEIKEGRPENIFVYYIRSADLEISGSRKTLLLSGENITVEAEGEGYASFFGNGTYNVEDPSGMKKEEQWAVNPFFDEGMGPGRPKKTEKRVHVVGIHSPEIGIRETLLKRITFIEKN
ncbi:hypothetical protein [Methanosarcina horonobensis]|uniref:hypothetical protein n=1 Tax=Methanosarcina horonobensis TaxID=418008 RepID=UPI001EF479E0|nr:hypothetical protein [Methanosarcina horonobensis]